MAHEKGQAIRRLQRHNRLSRDTPPGIFVKVPWQVSWLAGRRNCLVFPAHKKAPVTCIDSRSPLTVAGAAPDSACTSPDSLFAFEHAIKGPRNAEKVAEHLS